MKTIPFPTIKSTEGIFISLTSSYICFRLIVLGVGLLIRIVLLFRFCFVPFYLWCLGEFWQPGLTLLLSSLPGFIDGQKNCPLAPNHKAHVFLLLMLLDIVLGITERGIFLLMKNVLPPPRVPKFMQVWGNLLEKELEDQLLFTPEVTLCLFTSLSILSSPPPPKNPKIYSA